MAIATGTATLIAGGLAAGGTVYSASQTRKAGKDAARSQQNQQDQALQFQREETQRIQRSLDGFSYSGNPTNAFSGLTNYFSNLENTYSDIDNSFNNVQNQFADLTNEYEGLQNQYAG